MDMELRDAMLVQQLRQKHEMKQQCLHAEEESPLHQESEKLLALSKVAADMAGELSFTALLKKEQRFLESLLTEMRTAYDEMPAAMQASATGQFAKNSLMLTGGALHRIQAAETASQEELPNLLEEAAFLLDGADGRA
jgi:hypothetical protein